MDNKGVMALTAEAVLDNEQIGGIDYGAYSPLPDNTFKLYIDAVQSESNEVDKYDVKIIPRFGDKDVTHVETYTWTDWDGTLVTEVDTVVEYQFINGLPIIINKNKEIEYVNLGANGVFRMPEGGGSPAGLPGHPQFSYVKNQKALNYGSNCPINAVMLENTNGVFSAGKDAYLECNYIGRYGEKRDVDMGAVKAEVKYNDEIICNNYGTMADDLYNFAAQAKPDGVITAHLVNENMMVDGLQGSNITDIYCDQHNEDWTAPTLQMLQFMDANGNITDRFDSAEGGTVEFAGGDFNYIVDLNVYTSWFNCKEQTVDVSYAPYGGTNWETLDVTEIPENFYTPGFGYFYRGSLQNVEGDGWFDLKIKLTDLSGNWQEQTISPAFRIGNIQSGIGNVKVGNATEVARYTVDGRAIGAPQAGVNIVKMSDGSVKKVWVK
ncbi:MAG: hypothetical protein KBT10_07390 [Bacteroidales bacterium]|nr:hypothetical protein [Candidatus Sodaliphilus aphodohippi]